MKSTSVERKTRVKCKLNNKFCVAIEMVSCIKHFFEKTNYFVMKELLNFKWYLMSLWNITHDEISGFWKLFKRLQNFLKVFKFSSSQIYWIWPYTKKNFTIIVKKSQNNGKTVILQNTFNRTQDCLSYFSILGKGSQLTKGSLFVKKFLLTPFGE